MLAIFLRFLTDFVGWTFLFAALFTVSQCMLLLPMWSNSYLTLPTESRDGSGLLVHILLIISRLCTSISCCGSFQRWAALAKSGGASGGSGVSGWCSGSSTLGALGMQQFTWTRLNMVLLPRDPHYKSEVEVYQS